MNVAKALKEKNRISGKIFKLQKQVESCNRYKSGKEPDFNSLDLLKELQMEWAHLIDLKTKIAKANNGIADKLIQLAEAKAELSFWTGFRAAGPASETTNDINYVDGKAVTVEGIMYSSISSKEVTEHQQRVQKLIEDLQDEIDDYNQKTRI